MMGLSFTPKHRLNWALLAYCIFNGDHVSDFLAYLTKFVQLSRVGWSFATRVEANTKWAVFDKVRPTKSCGSVLRYESGGKH